VVELLSSHQRQVVQMMFHRRCRCHYWGLAQCCLLLGAAAEFDDLFLR
jgi:hypothetical protein